MEIKQFKMGFGESFMLCEDKECLLIDCGSESSEKIVYFGRVSTELLKYEIYSAMISHFHEDHINGFHALLSSLPHKFKQVYIPHVFTVGHHNNQVDYMIMQYLLEQTPYIRSKTYHLWDLLTDLIAAKQNIFLLERGDTFSEIDREFKTLWPVPKELANDVLCNTACSKLPLLTQFIPQIHNLSEQLCNCFLAMVGQSFNDIDWDNTSLIQRNFSDRLKELGKAFAEGMNVALSKTHEQEMRNKVKDCYAKLDKNCTSIVCHTNTEDKPVLFTGDVTQSIMSKIAKNDFAPPVPIRSHYYAIKAPHHGTYTNHYFNFGPYASYDYLMISNGETNNPAKRGKISAQYLLKSKNYCVCCTNDDDKRCEATCPSIFQICNNCVCNGNPPRQIITI